MERGKGPTCALFKGIEKVLGLGPTFAQRASGRGTKWEVHFLL
jgi:hypothetical protein